MLGGSQGGEPFVPLFYTLLGGEGLEVVGGVSGCPYGEERRGMQRPWKVFEFQSDWL